MSCARADPLCLVARLASASSSSHRSRSALSPPPVLSCPVLSRLVASPTLLLTCIGCSRAAPRRSHLRSPLALWPARRCRGRRRPPATYSYAYEHTPRPRLSRSSAMFFSIDQSVLSHCTWRSLYSSHSHQLRVRSRHQVSLPLVYEYSYINLLLFCHSVSVSLLVVVLVLCTRWLHVLSPLLSSTSSSFFADSIPRLAIISRTSSAVVAVPYTRTYTIVLYCIVLSFYFNTIHNIRLHQPTSILSSVEDCARVRVHS